MGSERALDIQQETRTSARCQSKMAEVIIGAVPLTPSGGYASFEDSDSDLQWKVDVGPSDAVGLYLVKVSVKKDLATGRSIESQLCQMVLDPTMRGNSLERALPPDLSTPTTDPTDPNATTDSSTTPPNTTTPNTGGNAQTKGR
jgi:hypothetical protein